VFFQTLDIALNGVTNIRHRFVARSSLGNTAGQSLAFGDKHAVLIRFNRDAKFHTASVAIGGAVGNATADASTSSVLLPLAPEIYSLHIRVRPFTVFSEAVDPRRDNGAAVPSLARARYRGTRARPSARRFSDPITVTFIYRKRLMIEVEVADRSGGSADIESLFGEGFLYDSYLCCHSRKGRRGVSSCALR